MLQRYVPHPAPIFLLWLVGCGFTVVAPHTAADDPFAGERSLVAAQLDDIDRVVDAAISEGNLPGAVVVVGYRGEVVFERAYGHRQIEPEPLPMTLQTVFDLASLTKPVATATSVMILAQQGQLDLHDSVAKHLPEFANHGKQEITIEQLLLHIGGLIPDNSMSDYADGVEQSIENLMNLELNYPPGTRFRYSDVGFQILGELVQRKTGQDIAKFSHQAIFSPLGMGETGYLPSAALRARAAPTERRNGSWIQGEVHDPRAFATAGIAGHAGLFSTAADLARYARMMANGGSADGVTILTPQTFARMTASYPVPGGVRGLGWDKQTGYSSNRGKTMTEAAFGHGGFTGTAMWIDPELDLFVIFLSNRLHPDGKGSVNPLAGQIGTIAADAVLAIRRPTEPPATGSR